MATDDKDNETKAHEAQRFNADEILEEIKILCRAPFQRSLARLIAAEPTQDELAAFARKAPDRWSQAISIFAKGSGYNDKLEVDFKGILAIAHLSDAEKLRMIAEYEAKLKSIPAEAKQLSPPTTKTQEIKEIRRERAGKKK